MLEALLSGVTDPEQLAELSKARMRAKIPQLREALASRFEIEHHGVMVAQLLAHIDTLDAAIQNLNERIELVLAPHAADRRAVVHDSRRSDARRAGLDRRMRPRHGAVPDRRALCVLGLGPAQVITNRPADDAPARRGPGPRWLTDTLTECAKAAARTKGTYFAAHFAQIRGRRG